MGVYFILLGVLILTVILFAIYNSSSSNVYRPIKKVNYSYADQYRRYERYNSYNRYGEYGLYSQTYHNSPYSREVKVRTENGTEKIKKLDIIEDFSESSVMSAPNKLAGISVNELKNNLTPDNADVLTANEKAIYDGAIEEILKKQADREIFNSASA